MARAWQATSTRSPSSRRRGWSPTFRACRSGRWPGRSGMPSMPLATAAADPRLRSVAQVAVEARVGSLSGLFDYAVPEGLTGVIEVGHRVRVAVGKRTVHRLVCALDVQPVM